MSPTHEHSAPEVVTSDEPVHPPTRTVGEDGQVVEILGAGNAAPATTAAPTTSAPTATAPTAGTPPNVADIEEAMRDVVDPELGINVVDLGLVYGVTVDAASNAIIDMTLTSAACPLTDVIEDQTAQALEGLVPTHRINWVWMPPWGPDKITPDGREQLRALGFNV